jgi:single-strand DNA-binding protein
MNVQTIFLVGRATKDVNTQTSKGGKIYSKFSLAVNDYNKSNETETVTYYEVLLFGKQAENAKDIIKKGDALLIIGKPEIEAYITKDKKDSKAKVSVLANFWQVLK